MTVAFFIVLGWAGIATLNWYWTDQKRARAERELAQAVRQNMRLMDDILLAANAMRPERTKPHPRYWGGRPLDRLMRHMDVVPTPDPPRLRAVDDAPSPAEVHSHATKGSA